MVEISDFVVIYLIPVQVPFELFVLFVGPLLSICMDSNLAAFDCINWSH